MSATHDVVVIGAGLSGLVAARELAGKGLDVVVLEARSRPGGRTHTTAVGGVTVDLGGEWVDDAHGEMKRLVAELGLGLVPAARRKEESLWSIGGRTTGEMPLSDRDRAVYRRMHEALGEAADGVDPEAPWKGAPGDHDPSVEAWLRADGMSEGGLHAVETLLSTCGSTVPLARMSFYSYAVKVATRGGPGKGNEYRVEGGAGRVAEGLAEGLGERVRYSSPVVGLRQDGGVEVRYGVADALRTLRAGRAVLALPFTLYGGIRFDPPLPPPLRELASGECYGVVRKMAFVYDGPVEAPALAVTDTPLGYLWTVRGPGGETGVVSFAGGRPLEAELRLPGEERERRAVALLRGMFGLPEPGTVTEAAWSEDAWSRGSYFIAGPGDAVRLGAAGRSFGLLHLAGRRPWRRRRAS
ncbi:FAD-dependent oxidoreductase [Rubrobacter marinus]|uniref:FAD-dependent oxidoreductase n=1 Tax=Rubrobacter marinus TaxID=2653852 RepID=A0A6G8Q221_9ACTN|nr:NAD(P)/FAD-dependent oxidoreductase [Rubrobacter marinus]QIN80516.1 FAD-dependent oxidoreductase [Rubrobacter marinus]